MILERTGEGMLVLECSRRAMEVWWGGQGVNEMGREGMKVIEEARMMALGRRWWNYYSVESGEV